MNKETIGLGEILDKDVSLTKLTEVSNDLMLYMNRYIKLMNYKLDNDEDNPYNFLIEELSDGQTGLSLKVKVTTDEQNIPSQLEATYEELLQSAHISH